MNDFVYKCILLGFGIISIFIIIFIKPIMAYVHSRKNTSPEVVDITNLMSTNAQIPTLEERLIKLRIDEIRCHPSYTRAPWAIYGPYTAPFEGRTILEAVEVAEKQFNITY